MLESKHQRWLFMKFIMAVLVYLVGMWVRDVSKSSGKCSQSEMLSLFVLNRKERVIMMSELVLN